MAACLVLANCASSGKFASRVDPKYGVSSSPRVVALGDPVPKGGGMVKLAWLPLTESCPAKASRVRYWDKAGTQGAGVLVSDTLMFERGGARASDPHLGHFFGQALPLHAGIAKGIFEKRGLRLELELTEGATAQRAGFAAGKYQIVHSAIDNAVYNIEVGKLDNVVLSGGDQGMNEFFVQGDVKSFADFAHCL